jgi:hypothetical protein
MYGFEDVQVTKRKETDLVPALVLRQRAYDQTTTLKIIRHGEWLEIQIGIEKEYQTRTTYVSSAFRCGPDIADMIAEACAKVKQETMETLT